MDSIKNNVRKPGGGRRMGVHHATSLYNSSEPKVVLTRINSDMFQSLLYQSNNRSKSPRAHHSPLLPHVEEKEMEPPSRMEEVKTQEKMINGHGLPSSEEHDDNVHHAISLYNSSQPKVLLTRINSDMFQSLLNHCNNKSKSPRANYPPVLPHVVEKEIEPPSRMEEVETLEKIINDHDLPSSEEKIINGDDIPSSEEKIINDHDLSSSEEQIINDHDLSSSEEQIINDHDLPSSEEKIINGDDIPSSEEKIINDHDLPSSEEKIINGPDLPSSEKHDVHDISRLCNSSQPKVLLTRLNSSISQSLLGHRNNRNFPRAHPVLSPIKEKDNEPQSRMEEEKTQEKISCHDLTSSEELDDNVHHTTCHYSTSQPRVVLTRVSKDLLDSLLDLDSPNLNEDLEAHSPSPSVKEMETEELHESERPKVQLRTRKKIDYHISSEEDEPEPGRRRAVRKDSSERDSTFTTESYDISTETGSTSSTETSSTEESDSAHEFSRPNVASESNVGLTNIQPVEENGPPTRRERPLRLVAQKKINYYDFFAEEKKRRNNFESSGSFSSASRKRKKKKRKRKKGNEGKKGKKVPETTEDQLKKEAMMDGEKHLSAYEKQRMKNIKQKLAFLKSLKVHDVMNAESSEDD